MAKGSEEGGSQEKFLIGYYAAKEKIAPDTILDDLRLKLPEYMLPSVLVPLDCLPISASGKVNRKALPLPKFKSDKSYVAPSSETEERIVEIWAEVLNKPKNDIGVHDNFFKLGGHSLKAIQVISRIRNVFRMELALRFLFEAPTVAGLSKFVLNTNNAFPKAESVLTQQKRGKTIPLSFAQTRLWFLDQLLENKAAYNMPAALRLKGVLNHDALQLSLKKLLERHEVLRTCFKTDTVSAHQVIEENLHIPLEHIDLSNISSIKVQQDQVLEYAQIESETAFDLSKAPLIRVKLIHINNQEYVLLFTMHHIISDGWSIGVLIRDFSQFYSYYADQQQLSIKELPIQYADYSIWQRNWLQGEVLDQQLSYWKQQLDGVAENLNLPTDKPRPTVSSHLGKTYNIVIDRSLNQKLKEFTEEHQLTLFMVLLGVLQTLLFKYTNQEDIVIGSPVAGRRYKELEGLIGFFVNTLVLRAKLSDKLTFLDLLKQIKEKVIEAYAHQDIPFEQLVDQLGVSRQLNRHPLFQVMLVLQNVNHESISLPGLEVEQIALENKKSKFDLTFNIIETEHNELQISIEYATDLFHEDTIVRLASSFYELVKNLVDHKFELPLSQLDCMTQQEKNRVLCNWNYTKSDFLSSRTVLDLFEQKVVEVPNQLALVYEGIEYSYKQLNEKANQLAHYLISNYQLSPNSLLGLCLDSSDHLLISLIAVHKLGCAFVPVDPHALQTRLIRALKEAACSIVITSEKYEEKLKTSQLTTVLLDRICSAQDLMDQPNRNLNLKSTPSDLAYIIFTSGSTGTPNGVQVEHLNLSNYIQGVTQRLDFSQCQSLAFLSNIATDLGLTVIYAALCSGKALYIPNKETLLDASLFEDFITDNQIDGYKIVPSHLESIIEAALIPKKVFPKKLLICGGETLHWNMVRKIQSFSDCKVINHYGPTEATIGVSVYEVSSYIQGNTVPIGLPLPNLKLFVLNNQMEPVPIGAIGELYIAGQGVTRGYLNQEKLNQEKFLVLDQAAELTELVYKTGDYVRRLSDGNLEFIGRQDSQVKVRGFRVDLGEIEAAMLSYEGIEQSAVVAIHDNNHSQDEVLVGYYTSNKELEIELALDFLHHRLPAHMVPVTLVSVEHFPLTSSGKLDKKALPLPEFSMKKDFVKPRTNVESQLVEIWSEVLKLDKLKISIYDNFFKLGGHSLKAIQVISRIRITFNKEIALRNLFEYPTVAGLAKQISDVEPVGILKNIILSKQIRPKKIPLSYAQSRLWFLDQLIENKAAYNMPVALELQGVLNVNAVGQALNNLVNRHESLRTCFKTDGENPHQIIIDSFELEVPVIDLLHLKDEEEKAKAVKSLLKQEAETVFDLTQAPLFRVTLIHLNPQEHVLLFTMHHIISDGWSVGILMKEFCQLYNHHAAKQRLNLKNLSIQYADYSIWQRNQLKGSILNKQLRYWEQTLKDAPLVLDLPTDKKRPVISSYAGSSYQVRVNQDLTLKLKHIMEKEEVTLFMLLLAILQTLLYRYTHQEDILIGTPVAGRGYKELEGLIGFFVNTLVMRGSLSRHLTFSELLQQVKERVLGAYAHQDIPFEQLVDHLEVSRLLNRHPLFQVMFVLQNIENESLELEGLNVKAMSSVHKESKFDLTFNIRETEIGELLVSIEYATDLFYPQTIVRMASHLTELIQSIVDGEEQKWLTKLNLMNKQENQNVISSWNQTESDYPSSATIHQLFETQVEKSPEQCALVFNGKCLSYRELNDRANQLANYLVNTLSLEPKTLVALCLNRNEYMLIAILAVLKAGATYVPIDPNIPLERIAYILKDISCDMVLTNVQHCSDLESFCEKVVQIDSQSVEAELNEISCENLKTVAKCSNLAYIIYTSGTTGTPKGVMVEHKSVINVVHAINCVYDLSQGSHFTAFTSYSFDVSVSEFFNPLFKGATLHLLSDEVRSNPDLISQYITQHSINYIYLPPALLSNLPHKQYPSLRAIVYAGEPCDKAVSYYWSTHYKLFNYYGPTEATIYSSGKQIIEGDNHLIGKPISNAKAYILDKQLEVVPIGVVGELYIAGDGISRGYFNRPALTSERFIANPFLNEQESLNSSNCRIYKTGDLARWLPDGNIEYIGRNDYQVKIRGYRVELEEIEAVHNKLEVIANCVVTVCNTANSDRALVAYIVPTKAQQRYLDVVDESSGYKVLGGLALKEYFGTLKKSIEGYLPDYMQPSYYVILDRLPLSSSGKINRKNLPAPQYIRENAKVLPTNDIEKLLVKIWSDLLGINSDDIGIHDNFFKLGGHSLKAIQVISRVSKVLGIQMSLRSLFEGPTVASMSQRIIEKRDISEGRAVALTKQKRPEQIPLSYAQLRLWILDQLIINRSAYNMTSALRLKGHLDREALQYAIDQTIQRHETLRTAFKPDREEAYQVIESINSIAIELMDLTHISCKQQLEQEMLSLVQEQKQAVFDLSIAPLIRLQLIRLHHQEHVLVMTMHHIISDAWSLKVLVQEVSQLYNLRTTHQEINEKPLPIQYADYTLWQRSWLTGEVLDQQLNYWKQKLREVPDFLNLPIDKPRPDIASYIGAKHYFTVNAASTKKLKEIASQEQVTLFMLLLGVLQTFLYRYTNQQDIVIGSPVAGRGQQDLEGLIGFFVNTLAFRNSISGDLNFKQLIQKVKEQVLEAYSHQDIPFEQLVSSLQVDRQLNRHPIFQVMLLVQSLEEAKVELNGLNVETIETVSQQAKFDLTFSVQETADYELAVSVEYASDLFHLQTIEEMGLHFCELIKSITENFAHEKLDQLNFLTQSEKSKLLYEWNETSRPYPKTKAVHQLFEDQADKTPNQNAIVFESLSLTYKQLNQKANQLANYLIQNHNLHSESLVGLCFERSEWMVIAILAVMKAGGAYMPIDPHSPKDRVSYMVQNASISLVLTNTSLSLYLCDYCESIVSIEQHQLQDVLLTQSYENPNIKVLSSDLAYVIYTSGTTGNPKGVAVEHKNVVNLALMQSLKFGLVGLSVSKNCLQYSNFIFDAHVSEVFTCLLNGHTLHILNNRIRNDFGLLDQYLKQNQVYIATLPPALLNTKDKLTMEVLVVAGDKTSKDVLDHYKGFCKKVINAYGPTEATVCASLNEYSHDGSCNIGKPINNVRMYILDGLLNPLPVGIVGEFYIGGEGICRGLSQQSITHSRKVY